MLGAGGSDRGGECSASPGHWHRLRAAITLPRSIPNPPCRVSGSADSDFPELRGGTQSTRFTTKDFPMNQLLKPAAVLGTAMVLAACQPQDATAPDAAAPAASEAALETPEQRLSYAVALGLGRNMANDGMRVDVDAFAAGLRDAMDGNEPRMTQDEIREEMLAWQSRMEAEQQASQEALATANAGAAVTFFAENGAREGVTTTESGLQYEVLEAGDGASPAAADQVTVHYRGTLLDGTQFDSSYDRGQPVTFGLGQVIPGWTEGLQLMSVGSKYKLFIPSELGYGAAGAGGTIGPNAALVFEVELLDIPTQAAEGESGEG
jgi:FKBP-type peptidyl-prolyl cis-trans isomerase